MLIKRGGFTSIENLFLSVVTDLIESGFVLKFGTPPEVYETAPDAEPIWTLESGPSVDPLYETQPWRVRFDATDIMTYPWQVVQNGVTDFSLGSTKITPFRKYSFNRKGRIMVGTKVNLPDTRLFASYTTFDDSKLVSAAVDKLQTYFKGSYDDSLDAYLESLTGGDPGSSGVVGSSRPIANDYLTPYSPNARVNKDLFMDWVDANQDEFGEELNSDLTLTGRANLLNPAHDTLSFDNTATILVNGCTQYLNIGDKLEFYPAGATSSLCGGVVTEVFVSEGFQENGTAKAYVKLSDIKGTFHVLDTIKRTLVDEQGVPVPDMMFDYSGTRFIQEGTVILAADGQTYKAIVSHVEDVRYIPATGIDWEVMFALYTLKTGETASITNYGTATPPRPIRLMKVGTLVRGNEPPIVTQVPIPADPLATPPIPAGTFKTETTYSHWVVTKEHWESYKFSPGTGELAATKFAPAAPIDPMTTSIVEITDYIKVPVFTRKYREIQPGTLVMGPEGVIYTCTLAHVEDVRSYPGFGPDTLLYFEPAPRRATVGTVEQIVTPIIYDALLNQNWSQHWVGVAVRDPSDATGVTSLYTGVKWDAGKKELLVYPSIDRMLLADSTGLPKDLDVKIIRSNLKFGYTNFRVVPGDLGYVLSDSEVNDGRPAGYILSVTDRGFALSVSTEAMSYIESSDLSIDESFLKFGRNSEIILQDRGPYSNSQAFGYTGYSWLAIQRLCNAKTDEILIKGDSPVVCWYMIPTYTKYIAELIQIIDPAFAIAVKIMNGNDSLFDPITTSPTYSPYGLLDNPEAKVFLGDDNGPFTGEATAYGFVKTRFQYQTGSKLADNKTYDWSSGDIAGAASLYKLVGTWTASPDPENQPYYLFSEAGDNLGTVLELTKPKSFKYLESCKIGSQRNIRQIVVRESDLTTPATPVDVDKPSDYVNSAVNHRKQISISNKDEYILNIPDGINTRRNLYHNDRLDMIGFISGSVISEGTYAEVTMNTGSVCEDAALKKRKYLGARTSVGNNEGSRLMILAKGGNVLLPNTIASTTTPLPSGNTKYLPNTQVIVKLEAHGSVEIYYTVGAVTDPALLEDPVIINKKDANPDGVTGKQIYRGPVTVTTSAPGEVYLKAFAVDLAGNAELVKTFIYSFGN